MWVPAKTAQGRGPGAGGRGRDQRVVGEFQRGKPGCPGFRKGKVPSLVKTAYREDIEKEVLDRLIAALLASGRGRRSWIPLLPPRVEEVRLPSRRCR